MARFIRLIILAALGGASITGGGDAHAASFDCKKAANDIERRICDDPDLSSLDSQLQGAYLGALDRSNHPAQVKEKQLAWLKKRDACVDNKCMSAAYLQQIQVLSNMSDEPPMCGGGSTPEVNACEAEYGRRAERELARYVAAARKRLMDEAADDPSRQAPREALNGFDTSQAAWESYRKAECKADYDWWSEGTIRGFVYGACWESVTKSRTTEIWSTWLHFMDSTPPLMPKPVEVR
jgi:uncharacterized protein